jgi:hypothetical protein
LAAVFALCALMASAEPQALNAAKIKRRWRESLALDLPREVSSEGEALVRLGEELARDGEALALVSRAIAATREPAFESAWKLLENREVEAATRADLELERARLL